MTDGSNTAGNSRKATGRPFVKGDPRINRKGRPKSFDALRELAKAIAHEKAKGKDPDTGENKTVVIDGHSVTVAEAILRTWATSKNPRLQQQFIEVAFGKVPQQLQHSGPGGGPMETVGMSLAEWKAARTRRRDDAEDTLALFSGDDE